MKKKKKEARQKNKRIFIVIFIIVAMTIFVMLFSAGYSIGKNKSDYDNYVELYWLRARLISCYDDVREFVPHCFSPVDCMRNGTLTGCLQDNCNWCCYEDCTMVKCLYYSSKVNVPDNITLLIPER